MIDEARTTAQTLREFAATAQDVLDDTTDADTLTQLVAARAGTQADALDRAKTAVFRVYGPHARSAATRDCTCLGCQLMTALGWKAEALPSKPADPGAAPCAAFQWIGQSPSSCGECGFPIGDHDGDRRPASGAGPLGPESDWEAHTFTLAQRRRLWEAWGTQLTDAQQQAIITRLSAKEV